MRVSEVRLVLVMSTLLLNTLLLLRYPDLVAKRIVTNRMTLRRWMERQVDPFPQPVRLGNNTIAWKAVDVAAWIERRAAPMNPPEAA